MQLFANLQTRIKQASIVKLALSATTLIVLVVAIYAVLNNNPSSSTDVPSDNSTPPSSSTTSTNVYTILSPATIPSKTAECSQAITYQSNGNSGPIQCADGDLNVLEWNALSALEPQVMTLGYHPTLQQVQAALCSDASDSDSDATTKDSNIIETTTYQISALYYGWQFSTNPTSILANSNC